MGEQVLALAGWGEAQRSQTAIPTSLRETKDFAAKRSGWVEQKAKVVTKAPEQTKKNFGYCSSGLLNWQSPACGKTCRSCGKTNCFKVVSRSNNSRRGTVYEKVQEATKENHIETVNINSYSFSNKWSVIVVKLKTSSQNRAIISYKIDTVMKI